MSLFLSVGAMAQTTRKVEINLTTTTGQPGYVSSPHDHAVINPDSKWDKGGVAALIDGDPNTHFHTAWENVPAGPHYFQVDLGDGMTISDFSFNYTLRKDGGDDFPSQFTIKGSNNDADYERITVIDITMPYGSGEAQGKSYSFDVTGVEGEYRYLRFEVTKTKSYNGAGYRTYFHLAEFDLFKIVTEEEATAAAREAFNAAYEAAAEVIAASEYATTEAQDLPLQTTDSGAAYYIWTNAQESREGPISQLVDGNTGNKNFFHTQWSDPVPAGPHYIEVDLGENCNLDEFIIRYSTRINTDGGLADFPDAIEIVGSNEIDGAYTQLAIFNEGLPQDQGLYWESTVVENNGYRYLRFNVTAEKTFWHMSEFDITIPASESVNEEYEELIDEIRSLNEVYSSVSDNADYGYNEYVAATNSLTTALAAIYPPFTLNVTSAGWATLYLDYNVQIPEFTGEKAGAYIVKADDIKNGYITLTPVTGVLPANTGIIVKANAGNYTFNYVAGAAADVEGNLLAGSVDNTYVEGAAYVLGYDVNDKEKETVVFAPAKLTDECKWLNNANKAYLPVDALTAGSNAPYYSFRFGEGTTGIEEVKTENGEVKAIYDLTGRRVEAITAPGIYIVGGKKVLVK